MRVLFVCLGNICRSPTAEAVFRARLQAARLLDRVSVDSAGTGDWHIGKAPDTRAIQAAARRGYAMGELRARQVRREDLDHFDLILAMDHGNLSQLKRLAEGDFTAELDLFARRYGLAPEEVPDPYYGATEGFDDVLDLLEQAADALLAEIRSRL